jgi:transposase
MGAALDRDLRLRVVKAAEVEGLSTREAGRRFRVGESTVGRWLRLKRATGDVVAAKKGNPGRSGPDPHAEFIFAMIEAGGKDVTLAEMAERLARERGESFHLTTIHKWLKKRGITFKKRRDMPPSRSAATSTPRVRPGSTPSPISTRRG